MPYDSLQRFEVYFKWKPEMDFNRTVITVPLQNLNQSA